jgi:hypothetical protein
MSEQPLPEYFVRAANPLPKLAERWDSPAWAKAETAHVSHFRTESSAHHPRTSVRLLHDAGGIRGIFHIDDQYVRSVRTNFQDPVWKDSCVEFFIMPRQDRGYFNLEMNAGGAHLCYYVEDPARVPGGLKKFTPLPSDEGCQIKIESSLPKTVEPEIGEPVTWELNFFIPVSVLEKYTGPLGKLGGQTWRGNFYKCGDDLSHPHWGMWSPVDQLNFHLPQCFGKIRFE